MVEPRKAVSYEDMQATLKRKVREAAEKFQAKAGAVASQEVRGEVAPSSLATPAAISWLPPHRNDDGSGWLESACKLYVVAKAKSGGGFKYTARKCTPDWVYELGTKDDALTAQALCETDAKRSRP